MMVIKKTALALFVMVMMASCAVAQYDAQIAQMWLTGFADRIAQMQPLNDVRATADPARAGEYLFEYDFGTVVARTPQQPDAQNILQIELKTQSVSDCRNLNVGQTLEDVIAGREITVSDTPLYVLSTQESGYGWSWAYVGASGIYGVEYITYGGDALSMKEYTLTYVMQDDRIASIRMQIADATQAQAQEGLLTAEEIAQRQLGEVLIVENARPTFEEADLTVGYRPAIGVPVDELIAVIGEPGEVQALPGGTGRMLIYNQTVIELVFDEMTGVEFVHSISCASDRLTGPRGISIGMGIREAAELFRCDSSVYSTGGVLYLAGEAQGIAPYGELIRDEEGQYTLRYACEMNDGLIGMLDIVAVDGVVTHWRLYQEMKEAAYGG